MLKFLRKASSSTTSTSTTTTTTTMDTSMDESKPSATLNSTNNSTNAATPNNNNTTTTSTNELPSAAAASNTAIVKTPTTPTATAITNMRINEMNDNCNDNRSTAWDLEVPPSFHCPKLMVKIHEILSEKERLLSEREISDLDTHECRELARRLSYFGRVRFQGIRTISSSGSKVDMQRRIVTWHFCYNRQLHGLHPVPENYQIPPAGVMALDNTLTPGGGDGASFNKDGKARRPYKRTKTSLSTDPDGMNGGEDECDDELGMHRGFLKGNANANNALHRSKALQPIIPDPSLEELSSSSTFDKLDQLSKAEDINKRRREAIPETVQSLRLLYETRRELFDQLEALDAIVENDEVQDQFKLPYVLDRARMRRTAEEASLRSINEQITNLEATAIVATKRRPL